MNDMQWGGIGDPEGPFMAKGSNEGLAADGGQDNAPIPPEEAIAVAEGLFWAYVRDLRAHHAELEAQGIFVHMDSVKPGVMNDKNPGTSIDITHVIDVLNAQNQAGLKTMATVIGRGTVEPSLVVNFWPGCSRIDCFNSVCFAVSFFSSRSLTTSRWATVWTSSISGFLLVGEVV